MFDVRLSAQAERDLKKINKPDIKRAIKTIDALSKDPFLGQKMKGKLKDFYRAKVPPIRIIYSVDLKEKIVWVYTIGYREGIYKKFRK